MRTSPSISNLTKALLQAQKQMGSAVKGAKNPFFRSNYADLPTVMEVVKEPFNDAGIIVLQPGEFSYGRNFIVTSLIHAETGEFIQSWTEVICSKPNDPQSFGAAQTYARRFGLQSLAFIPSEDDDGNKAAGREAPKSTPVKTTPVVTNTESAASVTPALAKAITESLAAAQTVTEVKPLKPSNFRKPAKAAPAVAAQPAADAGWTD